MHVPTPTPATCVEIWAPISNTLVPSVPQCVRFLSNTGDGLERAGRIRAPSSVVVHARSSALTTVYACDCWHGAIAGHSMQVAATAGVAAPCLITKAAARLTLGSTAAVAAAPQSAVWSACCGCQPSARSSARPPLQQQQHSQHQQQHSLLAQACSAGL